MLELQTRTTVVLEHDPPKSNITEHSPALTMDKNDNHRPRLLTGSGGDRDILTPTVSMTHHDYSKYGHDQVPLVERRTSTKTTLPTADNDVSYATKKHHHLHSRDLLQENDHGDDARGRPPRPPSCLPSVRPPAPPSSTTEFTVSSSNHHHHRIISTGSTTSGINGTSTTHLEIESEDPIAKGQGLVAIPPPQPGCAFPFHLHHMLNDAERVGFQHVVSWLKDARSFKVHDKEKFERDILFHYFRGQTHYKSFQRQLNIYGFVRIVGGKFQTRGGYTHEFLVRGKPKLCRFMVRTKVKHNHPTVRVLPPPDDHDGPLAQPHYGCSETSTSFTSYWANHHPENKDCGAAVVLVANPDQTQPFHHDGITPRTGQDEPQPQLLSSPTGLVPRSTTILHGLAMPPVTLSSNMTSLERQQTQPPTTIVADGIAAAAKAAGSVFSKTFHYDPYHHGPPSLNLLGSGSSRLSSSNRVHFEECAKKQDLFDIAPTAILDNYYSPLGDRGGTNSSTTCKKSNDQTPAGSNDDPNDSCREEQTKRLCSFSTPGPTTTNHKTKNEAGANNDGFSLMTMMMMVDNDDALVATAEVEHQKQPGTKKDHSSSSSLYGQSSYQAFMQILNQVWKHEYVHPAVAAELVQVFDS